MIIIFIILTLGVGYFILLSKTSETIDKFVQQYFPSSEKYLVSLLTMFIRSRFSGIQFCLNIMLCL